MGLAKVQERVDKLAVKVLSLQKKKQEYEARQIMDAYKNSEKTFDELITFLSV